MNTFEKAIKHFNTVCTHKHWVLHYCIKAGIPVQGILHDLSKFSPVEFFESVKYYQGTSSPIDACKKDKGWSKAWMHHKGHNPHHYEYWMDKFDDGGVPLDMPIKYKVELICDYLGAGKAYMKDKFSYKAEYEWWLNKNKKPLAMHKNTNYFITKVLWNLAEAEENSDVDIIFQFLRKHPENFLLDNEN